VDPTNETTGLITKTQLVSGTWLTSNRSDEVLVYTEYATTKDLKVGGTLTINSKGYKIVGLVSPTLTGNVADIYFPLSTMQSLASAPNYVNEVLVSVKSASEVAAVTKTTKAELPGATVLTSKTLADSVSGSLSNAHKLANDLGGVLAIVVLLAAFLIAGLLTLSSVAKRVREIGSLRAIGWTRGEVVRQVIAETVGIGIVGGLIGVAIGAGSLSGDSRRRPGPVGHLEGTGGGSLHLEQHGRSVDYGHRDLDRAPHGADPVHDDFAHLHRSACWWSPGRHHRRLARCATRPASALRDLG
jgi:ABC-type antimicrobial peptide transport system permease subunit